MSHYMDPSDATYNRVYKAETPKALKQFLDFNEEVFSEDGVLPQKMLELVAVAVALTTQCAYCIEGHTKNAVRAGATDAEIAEVAWVSAAIRAGGAFAHGRMALKFAQSCRDHG